MIKKLSYNSIIYFIISIFPFLLITGPFLSDFFCIILGILFLLYNFQKKNFSYFFRDYKLYVYFFIIFYIYININSLFSFNPKISLASSIPFLRIILFVFALSLFLSLFKKIYKGFYLVFLVSICFLFIDSIIQFIFEINIFSSQVVHTNRISSFFGEELIMGSFISRLLPIVLACSYIFNLKKRNLINLIILFLSGILIILSGERLAAFYYMGIVSIYFLLNRKYFFIFLSVIVMAFFLVNTVKPNSFDRFYSNTISQLNEIGSVFSYRHTLHYITSYEMFLDKKFLGHGLKSFRNICSDEKYVSMIKLKQNNDFAELIKKDPSKTYDYIKEFKNGCNTHPHNIFLEYLSELGLFGILFLILMFCYVLFKLMKNIYKNFLTKKIDEQEFARCIILTGILLQLFPLIPSGSYFNNWMMIIFHLSIGFYLSLLKLK